MEPMGDPYSMEIYEKILCIILLIIFGICSWKLLPNSQDQQGSNLVVTPSVQRHYTIKVAGLVFHTTDYSYHKDDDSLRFIDDDGENVVIFAPKDVIIIDDSK
jgi:hypothetical protein